MAIPDTNGIFIHNGLNCTPPYVPTAQSIPMSPSDSTTVKTAVDTTLSNIANEYDATSTYSVGDCVLYQKVLYQCNTDISVAEAWDSTHWDEVKAVDVGSDVESLNDLSDVNISGSAVQGRNIYYNATSGKWEQRVYLSAVTSSGDTVVDIGRNNSANIWLYDQNGVARTSIYAGSLLLSDSSNNNLLNLQVNSGDYGEIRLSRYANNQVTDTISISGNKGEITSLGKITSLDKVVCTAVNTGSGDVTLSSKTASSGGTDLSLVTTGEKYTWNNKADSVAPPAEYDATSTYAEGDFVTYNGDIYICIYPITTAEAWNAYHWQLCTPQQDYLHSLDPVGNGSFSLNRKSGTTIGACSFAEGYNNTASDRYSHAEGYNTTASERGAHAEGWTSIASGNYSHAEGYNTTASGYNGSHAEGRDTTARGNSSHAEGSYTLADGNSSHAEGSGTTATRKSQHTFGEYNVLDASPGASSDRGKYIEIVGNGTADNARSNARTLDWSGNEVLAGSITATGGNIVDSNNTNTITLTGSTGDITCSNATANVFIANSYIRNQSAITYNGNSNPNYLYAVHSATNARAINEICVNMAGTGGSVGYCRVCRITVTSGYIDGAAEFKIWHRGANRPWFVYLKFASNSGTDPDVGSFKYYFPAGTGISTYGAYIVKTATSNWELYIRKAQNWDDISIQVTMPRYIAGGVNMTYDPYFVTSLPSGYITATSF